MAKRDDILYTALRLFNEHGYQAVGVDRIRDEAKVSKMTLYKHFSNKEKLVEEVLKLRHQLFKNSLEQAVGEMPPPYEKLREFFNWHVRWFFSKEFHGCMFIKATGEFHETEELQTVSQAHKDWVTQLLQSIFEGLNHPEPKAIARLFQTTMDGMIVNASIFHSFERIQGLWEELCKLSGLPYAPLEMPSSDTPKLT
ncbi:TetR/AcrR family transcriptional regulator [Halomonas sp. HK25]|uniref:TetR/AcrR family transcriptional regulator n=1 Tax=Halomonas sp. HK25 TaxID=3394321 RepID=UPI0039FCCDA8